MSDGRRISGSAAYDVSARVAAHPRLVMTVALTLLLVAAQGSVGAETIEAGTNGHSTNTGP
jgi:hypothetical protein